MVYLSDITREDLERYLRSEGWRPSTTIARGWRRGVRFLRLGDTLALDLKRVANHEGRGPAWVADDIRSLRDAATALAEVSLLRGHVTAAQDEVRELRFRVEQAVGWLDPDGPGEVSPGHALTHLRAAMNYPRGVQEGERAPSPPCVPGRADRE